MKKTLIALTIFIGLGQYAHTQIYIDGKELREDETHYIEIEFFNTIGTADVKMLIDFGQNVGFLDRRNRIVSDSRGKALIFNSPVHGLNWLYSKGYEVLNVYNPKSGGTTVNTDLLYLIQKRKDVESNSPE
ncbi:hypothetical protein [Portibacter marinus]|uniref:hypothetical protein n=1 Tax=Portibacter marinus TaxID=2898660 RepID=UPI001F2248AC|nr:hypothetical protein [Portibacter marinus]